MKTEKEKSEVYSEEAGKRKMENPLLLSPQLNPTSRVKSLYKIMKSMHKEESKPDTKSRNREKNNRLSLLLQKSELHPDAQLHKFEKLAMASSETPETVKKWGESFDELISQKGGLDAFTRFLKSEFSEENIEFWMACEDYKKNTEASQLSLKAKTIYETFIEKEAPKRSTLTLTPKHAPVRA
ncbi:RGS domain-containing protein [Podarcis lilfordi]|uniref:RGS domain-containing protein n=1 Tax=Podarcis lilfordi TaxID=74358 RepID=A0AA35KDX9_9SAUR|nr:RGS domain-containing protein [Podarcis lilfordi]